MDIPSIISKLVKDCLTGPDWEVLKDELRSHEFVRLYWEVLKEVRETPSSENYNSVFKILFVNEASVIVQDVERDFDATKFHTYKVYFQDWHTAFQRWEADEHGLFQECWEDGPN